MQRFREWLWTVGTVVVLLFRLGWGWLTGLFKRRDDAACAVGEIEQSDGCRLWDIPVYDQKERRYFFISSKLKRVEDVRQCAHNNGLPRIDDPHPSKAAKVEEVTLRLDEAISDVWQAMVTYGEP